MPTRSPDGSDYEDRKYSRSRRFAKNLRYFRELRGMTQTEAAERAGVTKMAWLLWEMGSRFPSSEQQLDAAAAAVGVTSATLLGEEMSDGK